MSKKRTVPEIFAMKGREKVVCITAYDAVEARLAEAAGVDLVLVGDSVANAKLGHDSTLPANLQTMVHHTAAVRRGLTAPLLVADMPFGSYGASIGQAVEAACELVKAGAEAVKLEGAMIEEIEAITRVGVPVMGHVGMTPQSMHTFGGFRVQGRTDEGAQAVYDTALAVAEAGAFSVVLELIPASLASDITQAVTIPTIGIGAGSGCDGQVQVWTDLLGLTEGDYRHAKRYLELGDLITSALRQYAAEVREGAFPTREHSV